MAKRGMGRVELWLCVLIHLLSVYPTQRQPSARGADAGGKRAVARKYEQQQQQEQHYHHDKLPSFKGKSNSSFSDFCIEYLTSSSSSVSPSSMGSNQASTSHSFEKNNSSTCTNLTSDSTNPVYKPDSIPPSLVPASDNMLQGSSTPKINPMMAALSLCDDVQEEQGGGKDDQEGEEEASFGMVCDNH